MVLNAEFIAITLSFLCAMTSSFTSLILKKYSSFGAINSNLIRLSSAAFFFLLLSIPYIFTEDFWQVIPVLHWLIIAIIIGLAIGDTLYIKSLHYIEISRATAIASIYPLFVGLWGYYMGENMKITRIIGIFLIIMSIWFSTNFSIRKLPEIGVLYALATALSWSIGIILVKMYIDNLNVILANALRYPFIIPFMLIRYLFDKGELYNMKRIPRKTFFMLVLSGILTVISNIMMVFSLQIADASLVSPIIATQPVQTTILAYLLIKEKVSSRVLFSILLLVLGTIILF